MFKKKGHRGGFPDLINLIQQRPHAAAILRGSAAYPHIQGMVLFYQTSRGVLVTARVSGLPDATDDCRSPIFGFHIHAGEECTGNAQVPFVDAGAHFNPQHCPHPFHAGDLPPLFGNHGYALSAFLTDRFTVPAIEGKTVIIHDQADDFTSQPGGNAGNRIACGKIKRNAGS